MIIKIKFFIIIIKKKNLYNLSIKIKKIQICYKYFSYTSNFYIIKILKLFDNINLENNKYNFTKIFIDSNIKNKNDIIKL